MTDTLQTAITKFGMLLNSQEGINLLAKAGLHESSSAVSSTSGLTETEFRDDLSRFILATMFTKFQEIIGPAMRAEAGNLIKDEGDDPSAYTLRPDADGAWIRIKNIDVRIYQKDEGVCADLYSALSPDVDSLVSTWLTFADAECEDDS